MKIYRVTQAGQTPRFFRFLKNAAKAYRLSYQMVAKHAREHHTSFNYKGTTFDLVELEDQ